MGQEMIIFSAPQGVPVGQEMITFSAPQRVPVGQEMITFSAPQGVPVGQEKIIFLPHRDRPQDITTSIKHCNIQCFLFPPRTKQRYLRCFLFREHQNRVKTLVFGCCQNIAICDTTCPKCCILQCFWNTF